MGVLDDKDGEWIAPYRQARGSADIAAFRSVPGGECVG